MAQEGDDSPMHLMCELVDEDDPILQAVAKETDTLAEEKVCLQVSEAHADSTGMKAYMAPEVHDMWRSVASRKKEVKTYVASEVHGVQHGVVPQGKMRRIVSSWGKPAVAEERSSVLGGGS